MYRSYYTPPCIIKSTQILLFLPVFQYFNTQYLYRFQQLFPVNGKQKKTLSSIIDSVHKLSDFSDQFTHDGCINILAFLRPAFAYGPRSRFIWRCHCQIHDRCIFFDQLASDCIGSLRGCIIISRRKNPFRHFISIILQKFFDFISDILREIIFKVGECLTSLICQLVMRTVGNGSPSQKSCLHQL